MPITHKEFSPVVLILATAVFISIFANSSFFQELTAIYPINSDNVLFLASTLIILIALTAFLLAVISPGRLLKPLLIFALLTSASAAYFMDSYHVIIDDVMLLNLLETDRAEALDLLSLRQGIYLLGLGIIPSYFIASIRVKRSTLLKHAVSRMSFLFACVAVIAVTLLASGDSYASFFREHKQVRFYANPSYAFYSATEFVADSFANSAKPYQEIGLDAKHVNKDNRRKLVVMVVGETLRSDHLSLNGYEQETTPKLEELHLASLPHVSACGTSTAVSVPCMFSFFGQDNYSQADALNTDNVLDVIQRSGVHVAWFDNNSDSKGVADRVPHFDFKSPDNNPLCDIECRDLGMTSSLRAYTNSVPEDDILIVLHSMGNHGPAYYKRYPQSFEKFLPTCHNNQLEQCSSREIINTYDNAVLYTDYFLSQTINELESLSEKFETLLLYVSDHGESLGEHNLYLHGLPYSIAPKEQKEVPILVWLSDRWPARKRLYDNLSHWHNSGSHDNVSHSLLGILDVQTSLYDPSKDFFAPGHEQRGAVENYASN